MASTFEDGLFRLYMGALLLFSPATLFHRINHLPWYHGALKDWTDGLGYQTGDTLMDAGCSTGVLTRYLAQSGVVAHGLDVSSRMLRVARATATAGAHFVRGSALDIPFEDERFDFVIAASLLNIVDEPDGVTRELVRVCKPGGKVSILVPQAGVTDSSVNGVAARLQLTGFSRAGLLTWHRRSPKKPVEWLLEQLGRAGLQGLTSQPYLDGMVVAATGTKRK
jgi:ubiquinone/menaquinone biosynthesis C-methylase UbiE